MRGAMNGRRIGRVAKNAQRPPGRAVSRLKTRRAPTLGWIANENIADMPEDGAYSMENWYPEPDSIRLRPGSSTHATLSAGGLVETVMPYQSGSDEKLFAAANNSIYDVTAGGTITTADLTGQTGDRYVYINFATSGGQFLLACNGTDHPVNYNGSTWQATPAISGTGLTPSDLNAVFAYKERLFFTEDGTTDLWYLPVQSIGGTAEKLALGSFLYKGGSLVAGATWTVDGADGPNDHLAVISSEGEVIVFTGTDPGDASAWTQVGRFLMGRPIGQHCMYKMGPDVAVLTSDGLVSLTESMRTDRAATDRTAFTDNIEKAFNDAYRLSGSFHGWQITTYPTLNMAIINVPVVSNTTSEQYVMNVLHGAWTKFNSMNAFHWALLRDDIYFGSTDGLIIHFDEGNSDDGNVISGEAVGSYDDMGHPGRLKHIKSAQTFFDSDNNVVTGVNFAADFGSPVAANAQSKTSTQTDQALWDSGIWDTSVWGEEITARIDRFGGNVIGHLIAPVITGTSGSVVSTDPVDCRFFSMNILYEPGGVV